MNIIDGLLHPVLHTCNETRKSVEFVSSLGLGAVVQSIVSLTSSLRGQLIKCFMTS